VGCTRCLKRGIFRFIFHCPISFGFYSSQLRILCAFIYLLRIPTGIDGLASQWYIAMGLVFASETTEVIILQHGQCRIAGLTIHTSRPTVRRLLHAIPHEYWNPNNSGGIRYLLRQYYLDNTIYLCCSHYHRVLLSWQSAC